MSVFFCLVLEPQLPAKQFHFSLFWFFLSWMALAYILFFSAQQQFFSVKLSQGHTALLHRPEPWSTNRWTCGLHHRATGLYFCLLAYWIKCIARASWRCFVPYRHQHSFHTDQELIFQEKKKKYTSRSTKQNKERRALLSKFSLIGITELY